MQNDWQELPGGVIKRKKKTKKKPRHKAPRWYRNALERRRRRHVKALIHNQQFDELPPQRRKDADYNWS